LIDLNFIDCLDIASGSTVDYAYDVLNILFTYTIELPPSQGNFVLKENFFFYF